MFTNLELDLNFGMKTRLGLISYVTILDNMRPRLKTNRQREEQHMYLMNSEVSLQLFNAGQHMIFNTYRSISST